MKRLLGEHEIYAALGDYIRSLGIPNLEDASVTLKKDNGAFIAVIDTGVLKKPTSIT